jgi:preprotein translocase subunit SecB
LAFDTKGIFNVKESTFELNFIVSISNNQPENPYVSISCKGVFKFEDIASPEEIPDFFYRNSIAILFPYVRAYLSLVTTQANVQGIILPKLNLSHLDADLKRNTISK